jgi:hypothetical protein
LHIDKFVRGVAQERSVALTVDQDALTELARLDGCYALRTDLSKAAISKEIVRDRYKDLTQVVDVPRQQVRASGKCGRSICAQKAARVATSSSSYWPI